MAAFIRLDLIIAETGATTRRFRVSLYRVSRFMPIGISEDKKGGWVRAAKIVMPILPEKNGDAWSCIALRLWIHKAWFNLQTSAYKYRLLRLYRLIRSSIPLSLKVTI